VAKKCGGYIMFGNMADPEKKIVGLDLTAAELAEMVKYQEALEKKIGKKTELWEAVDDFLRNARAEWEREKLARDLAEQRKEIEKHKWIESEKAGYDIGEKRAIEDWTRKYAHIWRSERESLEKNGWEVLLITVGIARGLHMRPTSTLATIAGRFEAQVYVHRQGMEVYNFKLNGKPYINVKSVMGMLTLGAVKGDMLEFIATGKEAREALAAISEYVTATAESPA